MNDEKQTFYHPDTDSYETAPESRRAEGPVLSSIGRSRKIYHTIDRKIATSGTEAPKL
ncbi:MAG: hypothetical protein KAR39_13090 [Thermoplasmata archaeon]|nr:hypothetical protein [Thermoplasmata archaeon]